MAVKVLSFWKPFEDADVLIVVVVKTIALPYDC